MSQDAAVQALMGLLQLAKRAREAESPRELGFIIVNETLNLLPYRQAALWSEAGLGHVAAVSGLSQPDPNAPYLQWLGRLCRALAKAGGAQMLEAASAPAGCGDDWAAWLPPHALWLPLVAHGNRMEGGLLLARDTPFNPHEQAVLAELCGAYAHALAAFRPREQGLARLKSALKPGRLQRRVLAGVLLACLIPVRLSVVAPAEVAPRQPFMVRAPMDGVIGRMHVQPDQAVEAGAPLFDLDAAALQTRRAVAQRAHDTALEEYRQSAQLAVTDDKGRLKMGTVRGELEQRALELAYLSQQLDRVQVKAERGGVAVFGDANDWQGKAVAIGEKVMLLADPARVELVARMPAADQIALQPGASITLYPDASPADAYEARIVSVSHSAEPTDQGVLAYRVRAEFVAGQPLPRLGLRGTVRLSGHWAPFAYYALRRPIATLRQWTGW